MAAMGEWEKGKGDMGGRQKWAAAGTSDSNGLLQGPATATDASKGCQQQSPATDAGSGTSNRSQRRTQAMDGSDVHPIYINFWHQHDLP